MNDETQHPTSRDPSNTDIDELTAPLTPDDDVFALVNPQQGDTETMPVQEPTYGD